MYKSIYIGIRALMALATSFTVRHLFFTPPPIQGEVGSSVYSSCHAVGPDSNKELYPLTEGLFDVKNIEEIQKYLDGGLSYRMEVNGETRKDIQRQCNKARHERGIVITVVSIFFAVVFLLAPKPQKSRNDAGTREASNGTRQNAVAEGEGAAFMTREEGTGLDDGNETDFRQGTELGQFWPVQAC